MMVDRCSIDSNVALEGMVGLEDWTVALNSSLSLPKNKGNSLLIPNR